MKVVTAQEMRRLEEACASEGVSTDTLMEYAGLASARVARGRLGRTAGARVLVLVGPRNNGGDGLVTARHLQRWGAVVTAYLLLERREVDPVLNLACDAGVGIVKTADDPHLSFLSDAISRCDLAVDAVLGTGRVRPLEGRVRDAMVGLQTEKDRRPAMVLLSLDVPTGMDADTGQLDSACPRADVTVTFGYPKTGHFRFPGAANVGQLEIVDIGVPGHLARDVGLELLTGPWVGDRLPPRPLDGHKGTFGHALIVAGSRSYPGAAYLACQGAARVGPGLVTLACPEGVYHLAASKLTEVVHLPLPEDGQGGIDSTAADLLKERLSQYSSMAVGCGFGRSEGLTQFLGELLLETPRPGLPVVIDADGLNNLAKIQGWWTRVGGSAVMTPHPGEMSTLTGEPTSEIQDSRVNVARRWAATWGTVVALKGAHTVIAGVDGLCRISPFANPALASGGTGDVLTGMIAGLMAQGLTPVDAACCAVYLHGLAAESVSEEMGDTGALAGDLLPVLPSTIARVRAQAGR